MLCDICSSIKLTICSDSTPFVSTKLRAYSTLDDLRIPADNGCELCGMIWDDFKGLEDEGEDLSSLFTSQRTKLDYEFHINLEQRGRELNISWEAEEWAGSLGGLYAEPESLMAAFIAGRETQLESDSEKNYELVAKWISDCSKYHQKCPFVESGLLPSRLIDVGIPGNSNEPFLHITSTGEMGRYCALSYCWGNSKASITTSTNIGLQRISICLTTLPRTIQDAIVVTQKLGVRYLWVDALCILQDSKEDWLQESSKMSQYYGSAFVTIQALGATDSSEGLFIPRKPAKLRPAKLMCEGPNGVLGLAFVQSQNPVCEESLDRRAWTYQEWLLSPRILAFGAKQISWQCPTTTAAEGNGSVDVGRKIRNRQFFGLQPVDSSNIIPFLHSQEGWIVAVRNYSVRKLTFQTDRLIAISSIARSAHAFRPLDQYLAGLWRNDMPYALLWQLWSIGLRNGSCENYIAPSWSWASYIHPNHTEYDIYWQSRGWELCPDPPITSLRRHTEIIDTSIELAGSDPYGPLNGAMLKVRGPLLKIAGIGQSKQFVDTITPYRFNLYISDCKQKRPGKLASHVKYRSIARGTLDYDVDVHGLENCARNIWCLLLLDRFGLMLSSIDRTAPTFRRLGVFETHAAPEKLFLDACEERDVNLV